MRSHRQRRKSSRVLTIIRANDTQDSRDNWGVSELEATNSDPSWGLLKWDRLSNDVVVRCCHCLLWMRVHSKLAIALLCGHKSPDISCWVPHAISAIVAFFQYTSACGSIGAVTPVTSAFVIEERKGKPPMMFSVGCL
jgi:hypothetical protein